MSVFLTLQVFSVAIIITGLANYLHSLCLRKYFRSSQNALLLGRRLDCLLFLNKNSLLLIIRRATVQANSKPILLPHRTWQ